MLITQQIQNIIPRFMQLGYQQARSQVSDGKMQLMKTYADMRVGARLSETKNSDKRIVFTFDDYGTAAQVNRLLELLDRYHIRGVFFVQGDWAEASPKSVAKIAKAGHIIGDHTFSHPDLLALSDDEVRSQIGSVFQSRWLRPPRGRFNNRIRKIAHEKGCEIKYWSIDSDDWQGVSASYMHRKIMSQLHSGAVILFHIHAAHTAEALPELIENIREQGYEIAETGQPIWGQN
jgi:peptidoglycan/xylan/chitin deacetylase (PgdA/CDA1 family)